jgi:hypothetical protein
MCQKPSGILVYSTCSFTPAEDEMVVDRLSQKFRSITIDPMRYGSRGPTKFRDLTFNSQMKNAKFHTMVSHIVIEKEKLIGIKIIGGKSSLVVYYYFLALKSTKIATAPIIPPSTTRTWKGNPPLDVSAPCGASAVTIAYHAPPDCCWFA